MFSAFILFIYIYIYIYITNTCVRILNYCYFSRVQLSWTELMAGNVLRQRWFYIVEKTEKVAFWRFYYISGAFAKLRTVTLASQSVCLSAYKQLSCHRTDFLEISHLEFFKGLSRNLNVIKI